MTDRFMPRAMSFALAAIVTWSTFAGIDTLAHTEHAASNLMAQAAQIDAIVA
jgi:hypothetical protein